MYNFVLNVSPLSLSFELRLLWTHTFFIVALCSCLNYLKTVTSRLIIFYILSHQSTNKFMSLFFRPTTIADESNVCLLRKICKLAAAHTVRKVLADFAICD